MNHQELLQLSCRRLLRLIESDAPAFILLDELKLLTDRTIDLIQEKLARQVRERVDKMRAAEAAKGADDALQPIQF